MQFWGYKWFDVEMFQAMHSLTQHNISDQVTNTEIFKFHISFDTNIIKQQKTCSEKGQQFNIYTARMHTHRNPFTDMD